MYSIVQISGKQFVLKKNQWYDVDLIKNVQLGQFILLNKILFLKNNNKIQFGQPFLSNSKILGQVLQIVKGHKIQVLKTKPKKNYTKRKGHRQMFTRILI